MRWYVALLRPDETKQGIQRLSSTVGLLVRGNEHESVKNKCKLLSYAISVVVVYSQTDNRRKKHRKNWVYTGKRSMKNMGVYARRLVS